MPNLKQYTPLALILLIYTTVFLTQPAIMLNIWHYSFDDGTYSHAFLIPIIIAYLYIVLFKENLLIINKNINYATIIITLTFACLLFIVSAIQIPMGFRLALPFFITGLIGIIFKPTFKVVFPSLFLIFLLPIWGVLTPFLQNLSTVTVTYIMELSGIPIYVEDNFISIPSGTFEIADGCSGLRYLIVSLSISSLFVFLNIRKYSHALTFIFIAILGALLVNWIRIVALIVIGHFTNMESELMQDHNTFGWYLYIPFMIGLFYFGQRFIDIGASTPKKPQKTIKLAWLPTMLISIFIILVFSQESRSRITKQTAPSAKECDVIPTDIPLPTLYNLSYSCATKTNEQIEIKYFYDGSNLEGSLHFYMNSFTPINWKIEDSNELNNWQELTVSKGNAKYIIEYQFNIGTTNTAKKENLKKLKFFEMLKGHSHSTLIWRISSI